MGLNTKCPIHGSDHPDFLCKPCPYRRPPMITIDPQTDKVYEGATMCSETGKFCLLDEGLECDTYNEFFKEAEGG